MYFVVGLLGRRMGKTSFKSARRTKSTFPHHNNPHHLSKQTNFTFFFSTPTLLPTTYSTTTLTTTLLTIPRPSLLFWICAW
jgi:hypothetical protein